MASKSDLKTADNAPGRSSTIDLHQTNSVGDGRTDLLGLGSAPLKKNHGMVNIICFAFVICNSWAGVSGSVQLALLEGGPVTLVYSMLVSTVAYLCIAASMAELSSVYPTAGGQYHFASILAPPGATRWISYICGVLSVFSWVAIGAAVTVIPAQQIMAVVSSLRSTFVTRTWHVFLLYEFFALAVLLFNLFALKKHPWTHNIGFAMTIGLFITTLVAMVVRSSPKASSSFVWTSFINYTGWPDGVCFIIGLSTSCFMYLGVDAAMHLAEECHQPSRTVPKAIMSAVLIGFTTAFPFTIALLYGISDIDSILTATGYVNLLINEQILRSRAMAIALMVLGIVMSTFILNAVQETTSRMAWSLARDNGLVFSNRLQQIHPRLEVPVSALILTWALVAICGCVLMASTTAFNALLQSCIVLQQLSFLIPNALLLYQRRSKTYLPLKRAFFMPQALGWVVNIVVCIFGGVTCVFFNLPIFLPVASDNMNYTCVILGIAFILGLVNWVVHGKNSYHGPRIELMNE